LTAISDFFKGTGIQACNNASGLEMVGIVAAIVGVVVMFAAAASNKSN
jgi:hypothetical protein